MRKWIILAYIISILAISGLAKAESQSVTIESFSFDQDLLSLNISGLVAGNCGANIYPTSIAPQTTEDLPMLVIEISNLTKSCSITNNSINRFDLTVDLRSLGVKPKTSYLVTFSNVTKINPNSYFMINIPSDISANSPQTDVIRGILRKDGCCNFYLEADGILYLAKSNISLENYINKKVIIDAQKFIYQLGPGFDMNSSRPLRENSAGQPTDFVYILSISTI